ncbi:hypothetical protein L2E82_10760 [Cichorium intybus]|uniref:Uncharacterized protein n=1 Tax=Cichorium intybus TaxID=13427 RepID=A0ACB9GCL0_CICIN|nr:hypothetical protein L2E82_10760 [Cichorium intybus]
MRIASATEREEERRRTAVEDGQDEVVGEESVVEDVRRCDIYWLIGWVFAQECASPFDFCDIVTSTTHKNFE